MRRFFPATFVALIGTGWMLVPLDAPRLAARENVVARQDVQLPASPASLKFAVIGDNGTGNTAQYEVGQQMAAARARFPFEFVIMLGDNMYGRQEPRDFVTKFERPYAPLLDAGVPFYAALGNHDEQNNRFYKGFNMGGERYYTFARKNVRFFVFDSNLMDRKQLAWIDETMQHAQEPWKICYFHHPIYSDGGRHGPDVELRVLLEPLLVRHGADVAFAGHEHLYERTHPQKGITYFIDGSGGQLRKGDVRPSSITAASFDQDYTFMLVEIEGDTMFFQAISRTGRIVDSGAIRRRSSS
jgi:3',5'-cyclic AMP phosphodiesterase CpdA